jgi:hypothetical protein
MPAWRKPRGELAGRPCRNCGQVTMWLVRDRCHACYQFWRRHGRERPPHLWERQ